MLGLGIEEPNLKVSESEDKSKATITVEPLERGFALTIGNALRRTLLSALPGAAPIAIKINGALHEFTTVKGIKEDVVDIVLNIKNLFIKTKTTDLDFTTTLRINKYTPGEVYARDIEFNDQVEIKNPDLLICTLDEDATLEMEIIVGRGRGWVNADENRKLKILENNPLFITVDSIFSPVKRVSYTPETARKGQSMNYDKLTLVVETNGTMDALEATSMAAKIIQDHTMLFVSAVEGMDKLSVIESKQEDSQTKVLSMSIDDMDLSVRSYNCLKRAGINTVEDLIKKSKEDMIKVRNMGSKSIDEVIKKLDSLGLQLRSDEE